MTDTTVAETIHLERPERLHNAANSYVDYTCYLGLKCEVTGTSITNTELVQLNMKFDWDDQRVEKITGTVTWHFSQGSLEEGRCQSTVNIDRQGISIDEFLIWKHPTGRVFISYDYSLTLHRQDVAEHRRLVQANPLPPANPQIAQEIPIVDSVIPYDKMFAPSSQHDAVLLVEGKKLHVNKAFLSYHSDYFSDLFFGNGDEENGIRIEDVTYKKFGLLMSTIYPDTVLPDYNYADTLLELGNRFKLPAVMRHVENLYLQESKLTNEQLIVLADKYGLQKLLEKAIRGMNTLVKARKLNEAAEFSQLSDSAKVKILDRLMQLISLS